MSEQKIPELWYSPSECFVYSDREGAAPRYLQMRDTKLFGLPPDAVRLVPEPEQTYEWGTSTAIDGLFDLDEASARALVQGNPGAVLRKRLAPGSWETVEEATE